MKEGDLRVWWIPQVPVKLFNFSVKNVKEAILLLNDLFQLENNIKPDYSNTGGLEIFKDGNCEEWEDNDGVNINNLLILSENEQKKYFKKGKK